MLAPPTMRAPRNMPSVPLGLLYIVAALMLIASLLSLRHAPPAKRLRYASIALFLFACAAMGIAGCGGGGSSGGATVTPHNDSITAVYSGDARYNASTSAGVSISIH
jgi:hypothetical protein